VNVKRARERLGPKQAGLTWSIRSRRAADSQPLGRELHLRGVFLSGLLSLCLPFHLLAVQTRQASAQANDDARPHHSIGV
jgi:hypothetical protein